MNTVDPYFDESIGELRNLLNVKSSEELKKLEPQIVFANELELESIQILRTNNLDEILSIHKQLFKGVYDWAGKIRTVDIRKNNANAEYFLIVSKINDASNFVFTELAKENFLCNLDKTHFIKRLSHYYDQLNFIHPFREGNGRTQRIFWSRVAKDAGFDIDWDAVVGDENDQASRLASENNDLNKLEKMFRKIIKVLS